MRPKVYIPQVPMVYDRDKRQTVPKFDTLEQAREFGDLVILLDKNNDVWNPDACIEKLKKGLKNFTAHDYLCPMGSHHFMMWSAMILMAQRINPLQTLQWHSRNGEYVVLETRITP